LLLIRTPYALLVFCSSRVSRLRPDKFLRPVIRAWELKIASLNQ